jgi:hypothetical protein
MAGALRNRPEPVALLTRGSAPYPGAFCPRFAVPPEYSLADARVSPLRVSDEAERSQRWNPTIRRQSLDAPDP